MNKTLRLLYLVVRDVLKLIGTALLLPVIILGLMILCIPVIGPTITEVVIEDIPNWWNALKREANGTK